MEISIVLAPFVAGAGLDATGCDAGATGALYSATATGGAGAAFATVGAMVEVLAEVLDDGVGVGAAGEECGAEFAATLGAGLLGAGTETAAIVGDGAAAGAGAGAAATECETGVAGAAETAAELDVSVRIFEDVNIFCDADCRSFDLSSGSGGIADFGNALARTNPSSPLAVRTFT